MATRAAKAPPHEADRELAAPVKVAIGGEVELIRKVSDASRKKRLCSRCVAAWSDDTRANTGPNWGPRAGDNCYDRGWVRRDTGGRPRMLWRAVFFLMSR